MFVSRIKWINHVRTQYICYLQIPQNYGILEVKETYDIEFRHLIWQMDEKGKAQEIKIQNHISSSMLV